MLFSSDMINQDAVAAAVMGAFLRAGNMVDHASSLMLATVVYLFGSNPAGAYAAVVLACSMTAAAVGKYLAWRISVDAGLFAVLERYPDDPEHFDSALAMCLNRRPNKTPTRSMESRIRGAARLCRLQLLVCALQFALTYLLICATGGSRPGMT